MTIIKRGAIAVRGHAALTGRTYGYVVRCGACGLEAESPRAAMPNVALAHLRGSHSTTDGPTDATRAGGDGRPWLIITGNDANGGSILPFVRCGDCRGDAWRHDRGRSAPDGSTPQ